MKEGIAVDSDNKDALFKLLRVVSKKHGSSKWLSLEEFVDEMKEDQQKIYFVVNNQYDLALKSPFMEPF